MKTLKVVVASMGALLEKHLNSWQEQGATYEEFFNFCCCSKATIEKMKKLDTPKLFRQLGTELTDGFASVGKSHGFDLKVSGEPALFYLRIANDDSLMLHQEWVAECVSRGLFITSHHNHFINAALTDEDIALAVDIADDAFGVVAKRHPELGLK